METRTIRRNVGIIFLVSLVTLLIYLVVQLSHRSQQMRQTDQNQQAQDQKLVGTMGLVSASEKNVFSVGETVEVIITADSKDVPVTGYDAVVIYNPSVLEFKSAKSLLDTFDFFVTPQEGKISLTGALKLDSAITEPLSNSVVAQVSFTALKNGNANFDFFFNAGETVDSNLLSDKTEDILGSISAAQIFIGQATTLSLNKPVTVGSLTLTLTESTIPGPQCQDCQSIVRITVEQNGDSQTLEFINGGFDGRTEKQKKIDGTTFELVSSSATSVVLNISQ